MSSRAILLHTSRAQSVVSAHPVTPDLMVDLNSAFHNLVLYTTAPTCICLSFREYKIRRITSRFSRLSAFSICNPYQDNLPFVASFSPLACKPSLRRLKLANLSLISQSPTLTEPSSQRIDLYTKGPVSSRLENMSPQANGHAK